MKNRICSLLILIQVLFCTLPAQAQLKILIKQLPYEEINFEGLIKRYLQKEGQPEVVEGIYSVSCTIIKRGKGFLSSVVKDKAINRKDNYAKVAILKDWQNSNRDLMKPL